MAETALIDPRDPFGLEDYVADTSILIVNEDKYSAALCNSIFEKFLTTHLADRSAKNRMLIENALAEICCKGTSAKRFNTRATISVPSANFQCTLGDFCVNLPSDRENNLRVWCESKTGFADRTYKLIQMKETLRVECAKANHCSFEMAPVSFDYASSLTANIYKALGTVERQFIASNTGRKTGPSRAHQYEFETADTGVEVAPAAAVLGSSGRQKALPSGDAATRTGNLYGR